MMSYIYLQIDCAFVCRLLKEKRIQQHDNGFTAYIAALRGSSVHSLESLLLVPVSFL